MFSYANNKTGRCWPKRETISALTGLRVSKVSEAISRLVEFGWLQRVSNGKGGRSRSTIYCVTIPVHLRESIPPVGDGIEDEYRPRTGSKPTPPPGSKTVPPGGDAHGTTNELIDNSQYAHSRARGANHENSNSNRKRSRGRPTAIDRVTNAIDEKRRRRGVTIDAKRID